MFLRLAARLRSRRCVTTLLLALCAPLAEIHAATQVAVAEAQAATAQEELTLSGTLTPLRSAGLSPRVDGVIEAVLVDAGDEVEAGAALLRLDATLARAAQARSDAGAAQSRAARDEAQRRVDEARRLVPERHLPQTELDARIAALAEAQAVLAAREAEAREQAELVRRHTLIAPFAGVVTVRSTDVGEWVGRDDAVLELVSLVGVRLEVQAPQERFADLAPDTAVQLLPDTDPRTALDARIDARVPVGGGAGARTFLVRVLPVDAAARLFPGTSATARFRLPGRTAGAAQIPRDALLRHPDGGYSVFVVGTGGNAAAAQRRQVKIGSHAGESVQILSGVTPGEQVVVRGNEVLSDGDAVQIAPAAR